MPLFQQNQLPTHSRLVRPAIAPQCLAAFNRDGAGVPAIFRGIALITACQHLRRDDSGEVGSLGLLAGDDGNVANLKTRRRRDEQGGVERHEDSPRGRRHIVAVWQPGRVQLFDQGL